MKILALQLKRIGDLILTTGALRALAEARPDAEITLAMHEGGALLFEAIPQLAAGIVFGPGRGWTPWQQALTGRWDAVLDFTGTDRSSLATALARARRRVAFDWARRRAWRGFVYTDFVDSAVREFHTADHYGHLLRPLGVDATSPLQPILRAPAAADAEASRRLREARIDGPFVILHPGTARPEKYWVAERWAAVIRHLREAGLDCVVTGGRDAFELQHLVDIFGFAGGFGLLEPAPAGTGKFLSLAGSNDLLTLAALVARARLVVSCDTAMVHLAAAFQIPQVALFGPTNPFHWRPRHPRALVLSAAQPDAPLVEFTPRQKGAPMDRLSTEAVIRATSCLLDAPFPG